MRNENSQIHSSSSPFLRAFQETDRVWDEAAKKEWADDVERRLNEVTSQIDPGPMLVCDAIERSRLSVVVSTVSRDVLTKQEMAALAGGQ